LFFNLISLIVIYYSSKVSQLCPMVQGDLLRNLCEECHSAAWGYMPG